MRRIIGIAVLAGAAVFVIARGSGSEALSKFVTTLNSAKSLSVTYKVGPVDGAPATVSLELQKPNMARIDTAAQLLVADGKTITVYDKKANQYYSKPETATDLNGLFGSDDLAIWSGFFDSSAFSNVASTKDLGTVNRRGQVMDALQLAYGKEGRKVETLYISQNDNVAHQAEIVLNDPQGKDDTILNASNVEINGNLGADAFTFQAPSDAKEISLSDLTASKWYTNWDEAVAAAKATNRLILVDFYTDWCHWCKVLDAQVYPTDKFKAESKYFVFCRLNAEQEGEALAQQYGVNAYPTIDILKPDGTKVGMIEGFEPADQFCADLDKYHN